MSELSQIGTSEHASRLPEDLRLVPLLKKAAGENILVYLYVPGNKYGAFNEIKEQILRHAGAAKLCRAVISNLSATRLAALEKKDNLSLRNSYLLALSENETLPLQHVYADVASRPLPGNIPALRYLNVNHSSNTAATGKEIAGLVFAIKTAIAKLNERLYTDNNASFLDNNVVMLESKINEILHEHLDNNFHQLNGELRKHGYGFLYYWKISPLSSYLFNDAWNFLFKEPDSDTAAEVSQYLYYLINDLNIGEFYKVIYAVTGLPLLCDHAFVYKAEVLKHGGAIYACVPCESSAQVSKTFNRVKTLLRALSNPALNNNISLSTEYNSLPHRSPHNDFGHPKIRLILQRIGDTSLPDFLDQRKEYDNIQLLFALRVKRGINDRLTARLASTIAGLPHARHKPLLPALHVAEDGAIFLENGAEIELQPMPKAIYLFFLRHPEGVRLAGIGEHAAEIIQLYRLASMYGSGRQSHSRPENLFVPGHKSLIEKLSVIKKQFTEKLGSERAVFYHPYGERGGKRKIYLPDSLIHIKFAL